MVRRYFGTDGIRGRANRVITPELALKVGQAAGLIFRNGDHRHRVLIGKDTRLSGYMIENALVAGFTSVGMDVLLNGPMPTPGVAMLAHTMRAALERHARGHADAHGHGRGHREGIGLSADAIRSEIALGHR